MSDYYSESDAMQDWCDARFDADLEMAEMVAYAREAEADRLAGFCHHGSGVMYRETAFYPEQIGLSPGQMHCWDCGDKVAAALECVACGLNAYDCMGERGYGDDCNIPHDAFVTPPMVSVCNLSD